jgi:hypothetical protein
MIAATGWTALSQDFRLIFCTLTFRAISSIAFAFRLTPLSLLALAHNVA